MSLATPDFSGKRYSGPWGGCACTNQCQACGACCALGCEHRQIARAVWPNPNSSGSMPSPAAVPQEWTPRQLAEAGVPRAAPTEERVKELASFEVRRLLGSPHAFGALEQRVRELENGALSTVDARLEGLPDAVREIVREEMEETLERALGTLLTSLLAGKLPQYREDWTDERG